VNVLYVEDDLEAQAFVSRALRENGFVVDTASDGEKGLQQALAADYDVVILDVGLPEKDGFEVLRRMRASGVEAPVLFLTAHADVTKRIEGLNLGADDYLGKPFAFAELLARVQALLRRASGTAEPMRLVVGDLTLDLITRQVTRSGQTIELRPREYALLEYLLRNAGRVISKTMILSHVWDYRFDPGTNVVDVLVFRLREKIDRHFDRKLLHTVRGVGYVLKMD
jgi:two-component system OmpR family response regulator